MMKLSKEALDALVNAGTNRQGSVIKADAKTKAELLDAGMIGMSDGLTRAGSITREREMSVRMDELF